MRNQIQVLGQTREFRGGQRGEKMVLLGLWVGDIGSSGGRAISVASDFDADAAVTDEAARPVEHRLAADLKGLSRAIGVDAAEDKIEERLPCVNGCLQHAALRLRSSRRAAAGSSSPSAST